MTDQNLQLNEIDGDAAGQAEAKVTRTAKDLEAVYDIPVQVSAVLGKATMQVSQLLKLGRGAVVELDRKVGEAVDIYVNNRLVARGEVVVVDERLGVTMTEIVKIDRTLIAQLDNVEHRATASAIIAMGNGLSLPVVAEGVENQAQFAAVQRLDGR